MTIWMSKWKCTHPLSRSCWVPWPATRCPCMLSTWLVVCCWCHGHSCLLSVLSHLVTRLLFQLLHLCLPHYSLHCVCSPVLIRCCMSSVFACHIAVLSCSSVTLCGRTHSTEIQQLAWSADTAGRTWNLRVLAGFTYCLCYFMFFGENKVSPSSTLCIWVLHHLHPDIPKPSGMSLFLHWNRFGEM